MGLKDFAKGALSNVLKAVSTSGNVSGSSFPVGTSLSVKYDVVDDEKKYYLMLTYPDKHEEKITHDMIKCATILAMGVIKISQQGNTNTLEHGTKYLVVLNDGRQAVLTCGIGEFQYLIESVLF